MVAKGISTNKTKVILDNIEDSNLLSNLMFFGAKVTKKTKRYTYLKFNANKKKVIYLLGWDYQGIVEEYM